MELARTQHSSIGTQERAAPRRARGLRWAGRIVSGVVVALLTFDAVAKILALPPVVAGTRQLGYSAGVVVPLGVVLLGCLAAHLVPRTAVLGAILLTGYLGGAVATHVRVGDPLLTHTLFPIYVGVLVWGGLYLRDARLRAALPLVRGGR